MRHHAYSRNFRSMTTFGACSLIFALAIGCGKKKKDEETNDDPATQPALVVKEEHGGVTAQVPALSETPILVAVPEGQDLFGTTVLFPPKSLEVDGNVSVEQALSLVDADTKRELQLDNDVTLAEATYAIAITLNSSAPLLQPALVSIPMNAQNLNSATNYALLALTKPDKDKTQISLIPSTGLNINNNIAEFHIDRFGVFQVITTNVGFSNRKDGPSIRPVLNKLNAEKYLEENLDTTAPLVTGDSLTNQVKPTFKATSQTTGADLYRFKFDDPDLSSNPSLANSEVVKAKKALAQGEHILYLQQSLISGRWTSTGSFKFTVDSIAPKIEISNPSTGVTAATSVTFVVSSKEVTTSGLKASQVKLVKTGSANATVTVKKSGTAANITLKDIIGTGELSLLILADSFKDTAGNGNAELASTAVSVDNEAAAITIHSPANASEVAMNPELSFTIVDSHPATTTLKLNEVLINQTSGSDLALRDWGSHTVEVKHVDQLGNIQIATSEFVVSPGVLGGGIYGDAYTGNTVSTLAGSGVLGDVDETGFLAKFDRPRGIATDGTRLYVADNFNDKIRAIDPGTGEVSSLVIDGLSQPQDLTIVGNYAYVTEPSSHLISRVDLANGTVTDFVGTGESASVDGTGTAAKVQMPYGITSDRNYLYFSELVSHKIRRVSFATKTVVTLAGSGNAGDSDGTGIAAEFNNPTGLAISANALYVADANNHKIRRIQLDDFSVTTYAGDGNSGFSGDGGLATAATFDYPTDVFADGTNLYVVDRDNHRLRKIDQNGEISTLAGSGTNSTGSGSGASASFNAPQHITGLGDSLYLSTDDHVIQKIAP